MSKDNPVNLQKTGFDNWVAYVEQFAGLFKMGAGIPLQRTQDVSIIQPAATLSPKVVICSPHPDDETVTGLLPLRLLQESGVEVLNLAVTFGSDMTRKRQRKKELRAACAVLGFHWQPIEGDFGFDDVTPERRTVDGKGWLKMVDTTISLFERYQPELIVCPHDKDAHPAHVGTNMLVRQALSQYTQKHKTGVMLTETEFWSPLENPNLLIGAGIQQAAHLVTALTQHAGEVARTKYHLRMPARMMDTVRRGAELVKGFGSREMDFVFGELYRISRVEDGKRFFSHHKGHIIGPESTLSLHRLNKVFT